jgi:hypothetical protein
LLAAHYFATFFFFDFVTVVFVVTDVFSSSLFLTNVDLLCKRREHSWDGYVRYIKVIV